MVSSFLEIKNKFVFCKIYKKEQERSLRTRGDREIQDGGWRTYDGGLREKRREKLSNKDYLLCTL